MVVLLFAISAHEAAHAWMSDRFGDDTARLLGRVTLNPVAHTDPIGTLLIPIVGFVFAAWAGPRRASRSSAGASRRRSTRSRWRDKDVANIRVSLAGIFAQHRYRRRDHFDRHQGAIQSRKPLGAGRLPRQRSRAGRACFLYFSL